MDAGTRQLVRQRAAVRLLDMNGTPQLDLRRELIQRGEYPSD